MQTNWKNDVIVSCDQVEETSRAGPTLLYISVKLPNYPSPNVGNCPPSPPPRQH